MSLEVKDSFVVFDPPLSCDDTLAEAYVRRFFRRIAFGEAPVLAGFVGSIMSDSAAPYAIGFGFAAVPTRWGMRGEASSFSGSCQGLSGSDALGIVVDAQGSHRLRVRAAARPGCHL